MLLSAGQALVTFLLQLMLDYQSPLAPKIEHQYGVAAIGSLVAFAVVFRTQLGWNRYWEAVLQLHFVFCMWNSAYAEIHAFATNTILHHSQIDTDEARARCSRVEFFLVDVSQKFHILSACAITQLLHGDIEMMRNRSRGLALRGELRHEIPELDLPHYNVRQDDESIIQDGSDAKIPNWEHALAPVSNTLELTDAQHAILKKSRDRTSCVRYWILQDLALISPDLDIAPPIQSRVYQDLSEGMLGFHQAMKLADIPFPFPFAQSISLLLAFFAVLAPVYIMTLTRSLIAGPILAFMLFDCVCSFNELAKELENPFGKSVNDLPLLDFHSRFLDSCAKIKESSFLKVKHESMYGL